MKVLDNINYPAPKQEYKVLVRCFTFNHSKYIEDALNGFAMQQTDFPFVCLVMDDASTDGEQKVIKEWMERECDISNAETIEIPTSLVVILPHKININCTFAFYFLKQNLYKNQKDKVKHITPWREKCEYEAICEGDDYWIDPLKLQKQTSFLTENLDYSMVFSRSKQFVQKANSFKRDSFGKLFSTTKELLLDNSIPTPSVLIRRSIYDRYIEEINEDTKGWQMGDYPMWLYFSLNSKIHFIDEDMVVYRILENSACHSTTFGQRERFILSTFEIRRFYNLKYTILPQDVLDTQMYECLIINAIHFNESGAVDKYMALLKNPSIKLKAYHVLYKCKLLWIYNLYKNFKGFPIK